MGLITKGSSLDNSLRVNVISALLLDEIDQKIGGTHGVAIVYSKRSLIPPILGARKLCTTATIKP